MFVGWPPRRFGAPFTGRSVLLHRLLFVEVVGRRARERDEHDDAAPKTADDPCAVGALAGFRAVRG
jgi:hypothetical protein